MVTKVTADMVEMSGGLSLQDYINLQVNASNYGADPSKSKGANTSAVQFAVNSIPWGKGGSVVVNQDIDFHYAGIAFHPGLVLIHHTAEGTRYIYPDVIKGFIIQGADERAGVRLRSYSGIGAVEGTLQVNNPISGLPAPIEAKSMYLSEIAPPANPPADKAVLFVQDNGAGKTQLCVRFSTGAVKVITTET